MNKYQYYVNDKPVSRKELVEKLEKCCYKVTYTIQEGMIGIDIVEVDDKKLNKHLRSICDPRCLGVIIGQTHFRRKKI